MNTYEEQLLKFQSCQQQQQKLKLALALFAVKPDPRVTAYLQFRQRPAILYLIREGREEMLRRLMAQPWFTSAYLPDYLKSCSPLTSPEIYTILLEALYQQTNGDSPDSAAESIQTLSPSDSAAKTIPILSPSDSAAEQTFSPSVLSEADLALQGIRLSGQRLSQVFPFLSDILCMLEVKSIHGIAFNTPGETGETASWYTDGTGFYYDPEFVCNLLKEDSHLLLLLMLHSLGHCILMHVFPVLQSAAEPFNIREEDTLQDQQTENLTSELIRRSDLSGEEKSRLLQLQRDFRNLLRDDHRFWPRRQQRDHTEKRGMEDLKEQFLQDQFRQAAEGLAGTPSGNHLPGIAVSDRQIYTPKAVRTYDYRRFLEKFMVHREEQQLDMENFDPLWYYYSRQHYENLIFLEPRETSEISRLEEILIAIDTSGSCRKEIVQRFFDETFSILQKQEHFFRKMRVHIVQCDFTIQDYVCITSPQDWKTYQKQLVIKGLGDTDFTPVFDLAEKLESEKKIRNLKGILYFTDGDGTFPRTRPRWPAAFVFLNEQKEVKKPLPEWAIRLNLHIKDL